MKFRWTSATLLLTVLAVILALLSLPMKWYSLDVTYAGESGEYVRTYDLYLSYWRLSDVDSYQGAFEEAGSVIDSVAVLIIVWAFFSLLYLWALARGESGFIRGLLLVLLAVLPFLVYLWFMAGAVDAELDPGGTVPEGESYESSPSGGPILVLMAAVLQVIAVMLRGAQVLSPSLAADSSSGEAQE